MKINELKGGVLYIEDAFPLHKEFIECLENNDNVNSVIGPWQVWNDNENPLTPHIPNSQPHQDNRRGWLKNIDWDRTKQIWSPEPSDEKPRVEIALDYSQEHIDAYKIIRMIDEPYKKALDVWSEKTNNVKIDKWITKNYTIKKYDTGQSISKHRDNERPDELPYDWTVLIYLNDDYVGGEIQFDDLGYGLRPKAGSILFFPSTEMHTAYPVKEGYKYFIFLYIQTKYRLTHSLYEYGSPFMPPKKSIS